MGSFNISTAVMFILAAGGIPVFKHGNRSITSQCGSAELLAALGIPMEAEDSLLHKSLDELNFALDRKSTRLTSSHVATSYAVVLLTAKISVKAAVASTT